MKRPFQPMALPLAGVQLIEASAGTGKTYSIATLYLRLLLERRLGVEEILVVTFTEAATAELRERIRGRLQEAIHACESEMAAGASLLAEVLAAVPDRATASLLLRRALAAIDEAAIVTIHGFCHRILQRSAFESGMPFDLELLGETEPLLREVVHDFLATFSHGGEPWLVALLHDALGEKELLALAREAVRHREFPLCGQPADGAGDEAFARAQAAFAEARALWQREEAAIRASCAPALFLKGFREKFAAGLLDRLALFLAAGEPASFILPAGSDLLTPSGFAGGKVCTAAAVKKGTVPTHPFFALWQRFVEAAAGLRQDFLAATLARLALLAREELPRRLYGQQALSFDDLLHGLDRALAGPSGPELAALIRKSHPVALIDEFQDTDPVQYRIFQAIYGGGHDNAGLFLIGDPKQAIYSFRGADIFAYLKAAADAGGCHTMTTNWRADLAMVDAVNRLFSGVAAPFLDERIAFSPVEAAWAEERWQGEGEWRAPLRFLALPKEQPAGKGGLFAVATLEEMLPEVVAADIVRLLRSGTRIGGRAVRPADIAVLVHKNGQATEMQEALRRHGVAAVLQSRESVFASHEARELLLLLRAVVEPVDGARLRSALATDCLGLTAADLLRLDADEEALRVWLDRFGRWHLLWRDQGFMRFFGQWREEAGVAARLVRHGDGLRRLTNLRHLGELIHAQEERSRCRPLALCLWLAGQCRDRGEGGGGGEEAELRLESDAEAVQLATIHRSKGLEYPVVYCPYLWKGVSDRRTPPAFLAFHDPAAGWAGRLALFPDAAQLAVHLREDFAEDLRLLYVAVTRAKHCCCIPWAGATSYFSSALAYLLHGGPRPIDDLMEFFGRLKGFSHGALFEQLAGRVAAEEGWSLRVADPAARVAPLAPAGAGAPPLSCSQPARRIFSAWRVGSFSGLVAGAATTGPEAERDHDEAPAGSEEEIAAGELPLADFPRGAHAGNLFHRIFEVADFAAGPESLLPLVAEQLRAFGFGAERWRESVSMALQQALAAPLPAALPFALRDVAPARQLRELPFLIPAGAAGEGRPVAPALLADALAVEANGVLAEYAGRAATLGFPPLAGYLKGFVDLVFEHQGRWYLIDYKSNHLGERYEEYGQAALARAMANHHYFLQYHLYCLALDRYLRLRLAGYRYEEHFGGVFYFFLKGMHPALPGNGVFSDRPPAGRIAALAALFGEEG